MCSHKILIIGGHLDINITQLSHYARANNIDADIIRYNLGHPIDLTLDMQTLQLKLNGVISDHQAIFYWHDAFSYLQNQDRKMWDISNAIFEIIRQYVHIKDTIKIFNRNFITRKNSKIFNLYKAKEIGFAVPETLLSSNLIELRDFTDKHAVISKPIDGGGFCNEYNSETLKPYKDDFVMPYLVQERLNQPEIRIYRIGDKIFPFQMIYEGIDYRKNDDVIIKPTEIPQDVAEHFIALSDALGLDYAAGDFMTNNKDELTFLEINTSPMFARMDEEVGGKICGAMVKYLSQ